MPAPAYPTYKMLFKLTAGGSAQARLPEFQSLPKGYIKEQLIYFSGVRNTAQVTVVKARKGIRRQA